MQITPPTDTMKNQPDLFNIIRTAAFLMVLLAHTVLSYQSPTNPIKFPFFMYGTAWGAMVWFFMLSGYLLAKGFYNGKYDVRHGWTVFIVSRYFRIAPLYYFVILVQFIYSPEWCASVGIKTFIRIFTFTWTQNTSGYIAGTWFISTIFQLYVFAPVVYFLILKKLNKRDTTIAFVVLTVAGALMRWYLPKHGFTWLDLYQSSWSNSDAFFGGMMLCGITRGSGCGKVKRGLRYLSVIAAVGFILTNSFFISRQMHIQAYMFRYPTVYLILLALILFAFDTTDREKSAPLTFENVRKNPLRIVDFLAKISMGMYLSHGYLLTVWPRFFNTLNLQKWALYVPLSLSLCYLTTVALSYMAHSFLDPVSVNLRKKYLGSVPSFIDSIPSFIKRMIQGEFGRYFLIVAFAITAVYPVMHISKEERSEREYRTLSKKPVLFEDGKFNKAFGKQFDEWLNDHFTRREKVILKYARTMQKIQSHYSGKWVGREIYVAKDHWIFAKGEEDPIPPHSESEKKALYDTYQNFSKFVRKNGAKPYMLISPNKMKVYGEYNTRFLNKKDGMEDVYDYFRSKGGFNFRYPLKELLEAKKTDYVFYKTDHHWTHLGAYIGYSLLMDDIKKDFPTLKKMSLNDYNIENVKFTHNSVWNRELKGDDGCSYNRLSLKDKKFFDVKYKDFSTDRYVFSNGFSDNINYVQVDSPSAPQKKILIIGNSFSDTAPLIWAGTSSSVRWISANQFGAIRKDWLQKALDAYRPDIVVIIINANARYIFGGF